MGGQKLGLVRWQSGGGGGGGVGVVWREPRPAVGAVVLPHLWDELEERVREQSSDGERDEVSEHATEKRSLRARHHEGSQERGQVNHRDTEEPEAPHCGGTRRHGQAGGPPLPRELS